MAALRAINLILAFIATTAPLAHVLELPSKLTLDGPLWLAVQQHLYRGWGAVFGPVEIAALASTGVVLAVTASDSLTFLHSSATRPWSLSSSSSTRP